MDSLSLNKARWVMPDASLDVVERVARAHDLPERLSTTAARSPLNSYYEAHTQAMTESPADHQ